MSQAFIEAAEARTREYISRIDCNECITSTLLDDIKDELPQFKKTVGKVRDIYQFTECIALIATDRQSAFDRNLALIPYKGRVLTQISLWWFKQTAHIIPNHILASPHPSIVIGRKCKVFPIEFVVRGYITGSTSTSMWTHYKNGCRNYCGNILPDNYVQHQKLPHNIVTPTTKDNIHDELVTPEEIINSKRMSKSQYEYCAQKALELFAFGQKIAKERGLLLVDTKYEFGIDEKGDILVIDEMHTPDSSRYWLQYSYQECMDKHENPKSIDKEFLRVWFKERCDPYKDQILPTPPSDLIKEVSRRYILLYELITNSLFQFPTEIEDSVSKSLTLYFQTQTTNPNTM